MKFKESDFRFGLETEYVVVEAATGRPLWQPELKFSVLNELFESISLENVQSLEGLDLEKPHTKLMPFVVEGYHVPMQDSDASDMLPKGVEIRTPVCATLEECLDQHQLLFERLKTALASIGYGLAALSHHPVYSEFSGPQNKRRYDYWQWAMEVMTTYGPDINVGLPQELAPLLASKDFERKINYYAPALTALSVASPLLNGSLWTPEGVVGHSYRTYRRSVVAPPNENHPHEKDRIEFKTFDVPTGLDDLRAYFLLFMCVLTDEKLLGRATQADRIYELGSVSKLGLKSPNILLKVDQLLESAKQTAGDLGWDDRGLSLLHKRRHSLKTPADVIAQEFKRLDGNVQLLMKWLVQKTESYQSVDA